MGTRTEAGSLELAFRDLLESVGVDDCELLENTPGRVARAYEDLLSGYSQDPKKILSKIFESDYDEMVTVCGIAFSSLCEHHALPFTGTASVAYIPSAGKVVGLSKIPRLVDCFARRFQIQERLTMQIANTLMKAITPKGVAVVIRAEHSCMALRGVTKPGASMVTSAMLGIFRDDRSTREEFLILSGNK